MMTLATSKILEHALYDNACERITDSELSSVIEANGYKIVRDMGYKVKVVDTRDNASHYIFC